MTGEDEKLITDDAVQSAPENDAATMPPHKTFDSSHLFSPRHSSDKSDSALGLSKTFPTVGDIAVIVILFFLAQTLAAFVLSWLGLRLPDLADLQVEDIESYMRAQIMRGEGMAVLYPVSMAASLLAIYLYIRLRGGKWLFAGFSASGLNPNIILSGTIWVIAAQIVLEPVMAMLPSVENAGVGRGMWACVTAVILAPVFEEILCRGLVLETVRRRWNDLVAVAVSALFFGIVHVEPSTALAGFVVGGIFGTIYIRTHSLFSTIILHSINNAFAFALICFGLDDVPLSEILGGGTLYYAVYGVCAMIFVLFSVEAWRKVFRR